MAIKVSGTTVIDDSRQLSNIASVDATTVAALGAAGVGGGGGEVELTASGTDITAGNVVALNSDSTVSKVASDGIPASFKTALKIHASHDPIDSVVVHDTINGGATIVYKNELDGHMYAATVNDLGGNNNTVNILAVQQIETNIRELDATYDPDTGQTLIAYTTSSYEGRLGVFTFGNPGQWHGSWQFVSSGANNPRVVQNTSNSRCCVAWRDSNNNNYGSVKYAYRSGTYDRIFGASSQIAIFVSDYASGFDIAHDSYTGNDLVTYNASNVFKATVVYPSGSNTANVGATVTLESPSSYFANTRVAFDNNVNKFLVTYGRNDGYSNGRFSRAVVVTVTNTSTVSAGTPVTIYQHGLSPSMTDLAYSTNSDKFYYVWRDPDNNYYPSLNVLTINGTSVDVSSKEVVDTKGTNFALSVFSGEGYDSVGFFYRDDDGDDSGYMRMRTLDASNSSSWLGVAKENITSGSSGVIQLMGSVNENQSGLTPKTQYYVNTDGSLTTTNVGIYNKIGLALSATQLYITKFNENLG